MAGAAAPRGISGVRRAWRAWRNRLLASDRFRAITSANILTRPIARREARALFDLCAGFVYSQVLASCVEIALFERLAGCVSSIDDLAAGASLDRRALTTLLRAAAALRLVDIDGE